MSGADTIRKVCVIGAGVSGLAAAKAFSARGHKVTIVERTPSAIKAVAIKPRADREAGA